MGFDCSGLLQLAVHGLVAVPNGRALLGAELLLQARCSNHANFVPATLLIYVCTQHHLSGLFTSYLVGSCIAKQFFLLGGTLEYLFVCVCLLKPDVCCQALMGILKCT